jgi:hypothetical protein
LFDTEEKMLQIFYLKYDPNSGEILVSIDSNFKFESVYREKAFKTKVKSFYWALAFRGDCDIQVMSIK